MLQPLTTSGIVTPLQKSPCHVSLPRAGDVMQHDEDAGWRVLLQQTRNNSCHQCFYCTSVCTCLFFLQVPVLFCFHILRRPARALLSHIEYCGQSICPMGTRKSKEVLPNNNMFSKRDDTCFFCGSQHILHTVCLNVFSITRV